MVCHHYRIGQPLCGDGDGSCYNTYAVTKSCWSDILSKSSDIGQEINENTNSIKSKHCNPVSSHKDKQYQSENGVFPNQLHQQL